MIRKINVKQSKVPAILRSLTLVKIACDTALIEYQNYLDVNFKSPVVHQKLNQSSANLEYAVNHLKREFLTVPDEEVTEGFTFQIHEIMQLILKLDAPTLDELHRNLKKVTDAA